MESNLQNGSAMKFVRLLIFIFFSVYLALGLMLARDYGLTWDDQYERLHGLVVMDYFNGILGGRLFDQPLSEYRLEEYFNRHYGTAFQTVAMVMEKVFGFDDPREWYLLRHYMTFLVWFIALVFFYRLLNLRFKNPAFSLVGVIFMILSPRIFADAFYNSKDIVFLAFYIISTYTLVNFLEKPGMKTALWHALATALLINTRILGVIFPVITLLFLLLTAIKNLKSKNLSKYFLLPTIYYIFFLLAQTILLWPYLWENPFVRLAESFRTMGHFPWDDPVLYWGEFIPATQLPWHYIPSWMLITTPVLYTLFFLTGVGISAIRTVKRREGEGILADRLNMALFFLPLLAVIILQSTLYDGWRQMFFLYGPFMMLAMSGFYEVLQWSKRLPSAKASRYLRMLLFATVIWTAGTTAAFMIRYHPHQNVYFNFLAGHETTRHFEADYWGLSYRQALEYLTAHDQRDTIPVFAINFPGRFNAQILQPEKRKSLHFVEPEEADYWLSNYRFPGEHERFFKKIPPYDQVIWEKRVKGNAIVGIYRLP